MEFFSIRRYRSGNSFIVAFLKSSFIFVLFLILVSCSGKKEVKTRDAFDPEKALTKASELIDKKDFEEARQLLTEVKNRDFSKKYAPIAQLKIADSFSREEEYDAAVEEYKKFLDIYPDHKNASYAQYQIAMTYFAQIEGPERGYGAAAKALQEFEKLKKMFPRNPYRETVELRIERCKDTIANYEYLVGEFYYKKGSYTAALDRLLKLMSKFPDHKKEPAVLYTIAMSYKKLGDKDNASEYFKRLIEKYPNDKLIKDANKELASIGK